jgi:hypothetical protein
VQWTSAHVLCCLFGKRNTVNPSTDALCQSSQTALILKNCISIYCFSWPDNGQMTVFKEVKVNGAVLAAKSLIVREMMSSGIRDTTANSPIVLKMQQVGESVRP